MSRAEQAKGEGQGQAPGQAQAQVNPSSGAGALLPLPPALSPPFVNATEALKCAWIAAALGVLLAASLLLLATKHAAVGSYVALIIAFHALEFTAVALYRPREFGATAFLLNHSAGFNAAIALGLVEYFLRPTLAAALPHTLSLIVTHAFPAKELRSIAFSGATMGLMIRFAAMREAGVSFAHLVQEDPLPQQRLVTSGLYSYMRHPSYCGWFVWAVATQLVLGNVICAAVAFVVSVLFFRFRVREEEMLLLQPHFFGMQYARYIAEVTRTGVPFVPGIRVQLRRTDGTDATVPRREPTGGTTATTAERKKSE